MKEEILSLNNQDLGRLVILSKSPMASVCSSQSEYEDLLRDWIKKLRDKIWIPGTPWNIPDKHKHAIIEQYEQLETLD
jgi:hypothetical protein